LLDGEEDLDGLLIPAWNKRTSSRRLLAMH
jgi:hypothetical protein